MPPKLYSSQQIVKDPRTRGFALVSQRGSHVKYRKTGSPTPHRHRPRMPKEIPRGTFRSILRQSGLDQSAFERG